MPNFQLALLKLHIPANKGLLIITRMACSGRVSGFSLNYPEPSVLPTPGLCCFIGREVKGVIDRYVGFLRRSLRDGGENDTMARGWLEVFINGLVLGCL